MSYNLKYQNMERRGVYARHLSGGGTLPHRVHRAKEIMRELDRQIDAALPRSLRLDLEQLTFSDSSGIAVLLRAYRRMRQLEGSMEVCNTPAQARKVFQAAGLEKLIQFAEKSE